MVKVVKIFFASSYTFKEFRLSLEQRFKEKEVELEKRGINVRFEVIIWENRSETMQLDGSQNKYNYHIEQSDFFVLMASKRIGEYTYEEFKVAERTFENIALPKILILLDEDTTDEEDSLKEFKEELSSKKHYYSTFKDFDELWQKIDKELNFRIEKIFKKVASGEKAKEKIGEIVGDFYTDILIGRERVLAKIYKYYFDDNNSSNIFVLSGEGGLGKTTVASKYYHLHLQRDNYSHYIWCTADNGIFQALLALQSDLEVKFDKDADEKENIKTILEKIDSLSKPILMVVDNVDDIEVFENEYNFLIKYTKNIHLIITTRLSKELFYYGEKIEAIEPLKPREAKELFLKYYTNYSKDEENYLDELLEYTGYNTLVIELQAKHIQKHDKSIYNIKTLLDDLKEDLSNSKTTKIGVKYKGLGRVTPEEVISSMYNLNSLSEDEKRVLSVLSLLPEKSISYKELEQWILIDELYNTTQGLNEKGWIRWDKTTSLIKVNIIIAKIVREKNKASLYQNAKKLIDEVNKVLDYEGLVANLKNYLKATIYTPYAESILKYLKDNKEAYYDLSLIADRVGQFYFSYSSLPKALSYYKKYNNLSIKLFNSNKTNLNFKDNLAISYNKLGNIYIALGNLKKAQKAYEEYSDLEKKLYKSNKQDINFKRAFAISNEKLGNVHAAIGNFSKAEKLYKEEKRLFKELYESNMKNITFKHSLAISYSKLGNIYTSIRDLPNAYIFYKKYNNLIKELYQIDNNNMYKNDLAISHFYIADTNFYLNKNIEISLINYSKALEIEKDLYFSNYDNSYIKNILAICYNGFAKCNNKINKIDIADKNFKEFTKLANDVDWKNFKEPLWLNLFALGFYNYAKFLKKIDKYNLAKIYIDKSYNLYQELTTEYPKNKEFKSNFKILVEIM